jgi:hypothetical protein
MVKPAKGVDLRFLEERKAIVTNLVQLVESVSVKPAAFLRRHPGVSETTANDEPAIGRQSLRNLVSISPMFYTQIFV